MNEESKYVDFHVHAQKNQEIIWAELSVTYAYWWKNRPPDYAGEVTELTSLLAHNFEEYFETNAQEIWDRLHYREQKHYAFKFVANWLAEQLYHYRNP